MWRLWLRSWPELVTLRQARPLRTLDGRMCSSHPCRMRPHSKTRPKQIKISSRCPRSSINDFPNWELSWANSMADINPDLLTVASTRNAVEQRQLTATSVAEAFYEKISTDDKHI